MTLYYLAVGNIITDSYNNVFRIHSHFADGINVHKHSDLVQPDPKLIPVPFGIDEHDCITEGLVHNIQKSKFKIADRPFETDRDLSLLKLEITSIKSAIESGQTKETIAKLLSEKDALMVQNGQLASTNADLSTQRDNLQGDVIAGKARTRNLKKSYKATIEGMELLSRTPIKKS